MILSAAIKQAINQNQTVFTTQAGEPLNRLLTVGGSEAHQCIRKTWFCKNEHPHDSAYVENKGFFIRGHAIEDTVVDLLNSVLPDNFEYLYTGNDQRSLVDGQVSATPDGLLRNKDTGEEIVIEIKSLDPRSNFDKPKDAHIFQAQLQTELFNKLTKHAPQRAVLIYVDASDYSHVVQFDVERCESVLVGTHTRAKMIFTATNPTTLPAEGKYSGECRYCPYTTACGEAVIDSFPTDKIDDLTEELENKLGWFVNERQGADANIKKNTKLKGSLDERIKLLLRDHNIKACRGEDWSISYASIAGRKSLDTSSVEDAGIDLSPFYVLGKPSDRLTVKSR